MEGSPLINLSDDGKPNGLANGLLLKASDVSFQGALDALRDSSDRTRETVKGHGVKDHGADRGAKNAAEGRERAGESRGRPEQETSSADSEAPWSTRDERLDKPVEATRKPSDMKPARGQEPEPEMPEASIDLVTGEQTSKPADAIAWPWEAAVLPLQPCAVPESAQLPTDLSLGIPAAGEPVGDPQVLPPTSSDNRLEAPPITFHPAFYQGASTDPNRRASGNADGTLVRSLTAAAFSTAREALPAPGFVMEQAGGPGEENGRSGTGAGYGDALPAPTGTAAGTRGTSFTEAARMEAELARAEQEFGRRHRIRNLQAHVLDQIRMQVDPTRNEARIRLNPPELGEIKIHMMMEENRLTVRMEVGEILVRSLLERDLHHLKEILAESGIDVDRFDIHHRGRGPHGKGDRPWDENPDAAREGEEEEEHPMNLGTMRGPVKLSSEPGSVDYLVF